MNKFVKLLTASAILAAGTAQASTSGLITEWSYVNEAGFTTYTGGGVSASASSNTNLSTSPTYDKLSWGTPIYFNGSTQGKSNLLIDTPITGTVATDGAAAEGTDIIHNNWIVGNENGTLETAEMLDILVLTPTKIDGSSITGAPAIPAPEITFFVDFFETSNYVDYGFSSYPNATSKTVDTSKTCPNGEANGTGVNVNGCGDIFVINADAPGLSFDIDPLTGDLLFSTLVSLAGIPGVSSDWAYEVTVMLSGVTSINDAACTAVGEAAGCLGFITQEEAVNTLEASFTVKSIFVSEPAPLAILGATLIGLGLRRRAVKK